jgi:hypothetical protein
VIAASAIAGCTGPPEDLSDSQWRAVPLGGSVRVLASIDRGETRIATTVDVPVVAGEASIDVDRLGGTTIAIDRLDLALDDVELPESILPHGVRLTDLRLTMESPIATDHGSAEIALSLAWSMRIDGRTWALAPQRLDGLALDTATGDDGDTVTLDAHVRGDGVRWSWADIVTFADVAIDVRGET